MAGARLARDGTQGAVFSSQYAQPLTSIDRLLLQELNSLDWLAYGFRRIFCASQISVSDCEPWVFLQDRRWLRFLPQGPVWPLLSIVQGLKRQIAISY